MSLSLPPDLLSATSGRRKVGLHFQFQKGPQNETISVVGAARRSDSGVSIVLVVQWKAQPSVLLKLHGLGAWFHAAPKLGLNTELLGDGTRKRAPRGIQLLSQIGSPLKFIRRRFSLLLQLCRVPLSPRKSACLGVMRDASARATVPIHVIGSLWPNLSRCRQPD